MTKVQPIHICVLTTAHPLDDVRVSNKFCQSFRNQGYKVTWVGPDFALFDSKNYDRYGVDYRLYPKPKGKLGRLFSHRKLYGMARGVPKVDIYFAPDPDSAIIAVKLSKQSSARAIFDVHEIYHDVMLSRWMPRLAVKLFKPIALKKLIKIASSCDLVIGVSNGVLEPFGEIPKNQYVIRSFAPKWFAGETLNEECLTERKCLTLMHGKSAVSRGTKVVLDALALVREHTSAIRVVMLEAFSANVEGFGKKEFQEYIGARDIDDLVCLHKSIPMHEMPGLLKKCEAGLIAYNRRLGQDSLPNRLFEYMAYGLAIIAPYYAKEIAHIIKAEKCGLLVDFENPQSIAQAIIHLQSHRKECREMGRRARAAFEARYNWDEEVRPLIGYIEGKCRRM